jgi:hypothetical protein
MSNRCYLTITPYERIYPSAGDLAFELEQHTALASAGCVPLLWLAAFSASDLCTQTVPPARGRSEALTLEAPLAKRSDALARLEERRSWLVGLYADRGDLTHHLDLLLEHLRTYDGMWISIELEEIAVLHRDPAAWYAELRRCLELLDRRDDSVRAPLAALSTVMLDERIVALGAASKATRKEQWNFFRVLGEGWGRPSPWD